MPAKDSRRDWQIRVKDIIECVARIQRYTKGMNYEQFSNDSKTIDAVIRNLEINETLIILFLPGMRLSEMNWYE